MTIWPHSLPFPIDSVLIQVSVRGRRPCLFLARSHPFLSSVATCFYLQRVSLSSGVSCAFLRDLSFSGNGMEAGTGRTSPATHANENRTRGLSNIQALRRPRLILVPGAQRFPGPAAVVASEAFLSRWTFIIPLINPAIECPLLQKDCNYIWARSEHTRHLHTTRIPANSRVRGCLLGPNASK